MSSKATVGDVYGKIVNEVIESSRTAFEEDGIDMSALDLLQSEWKRKLSELKVAGLPWDPTPVQAKQESNVPTTVKQQPQSMASSSARSTPPTQSSLNTIPPIKSENQSYPSQPVQQSYPPQQAPPSYSPPNFPQGQALSARDRAAMHLHQNFGDRAGAQIAELQGGQRAPQQTQQGPYSKQDDQKSSLPSMDNYRPNVVQHSPPIKTDQTDGAGDDLEEWNVEYARRKEAFKQGRGQNERLMKAHVMASQQQLEGGGLMMPLDQRATYSAGTILSDSSLPIRQIPSLAKAQGDAAGDDEDEEVDENAINSDLDDPEDAADDIEGAESTGNIMLCTYDKVQRVKNKWKCTLKDGVLGIEGQDYLFHKGQGEFEW